MTAIATGSTVRIAPAFARAAERDLTLTVVEVADGAVTATFDHNGKTIRVAARAVVAVPSIAEAAFATDPAAREAIAADRRAARADAEARARSARRAAFPADRLPSVTPPHRVTTDLHSWEVTARTGEATWSTITVEALDHVEACAIARRLLGLPARHPIARCV